MKKHRQVGTIALFVLAMAPADAQQIHEAISSGGGDVSGTGGSVSYTIGQMFYTTTSDASGTSAAGIQTTLNLGPPLPVTLISFEGACEAGMVRLSWQTSMELNNDFFVAEKSTDAKVWMPVDTIEGGNEPGSYSCVDERPATPLSYYRLKQVDTDGTFAYSRLIHVLGCAGETRAVAIYPNPTDTGIYLAMENGEGTEYEIYNLKGILLRRDRVRSGKTYIDMRAWVTGAYFLRVTQNKYVINSFSIVKN